MEKKLSDYLHLYLGCECKTYSGFGKLKRIETNGFWLVDLSDNKATVGNINDVGKPPKSILKPILRPLSSLTADELNNAIDPMLYGLSSIEGTENICMQAAELTKYLLSLHVDIFELIESGLAIDITKI